MKRQQRIRYELAHSARKYTRGSTKDNDEVKRIGRTYDLSTGGGPLRAYAMHRQGAKYW